MLRKFYFLCITISTTFWAFNTFVLLMTLNGELELELGAKATKEYNLKGRNMK